MAEAQHQSISIPFSNKGLVQRIDVGDLQEGQYYTLKNMISAQEGSLEVRAGSKKIGAWGATLGESVQSISKLRKSATDTLNPRYFTTNGNVWRCFPDASGKYLAGSLTDITGTASIHNDRVGMTQFNSGEANKPQAYFAAGNGNYRDDGSYSALQRWGIVPPTRPALAYLGAHIVKKIAFTSGANTRVSDTVSSATAVTTATTACQYTITPTAGATTTALLLDGMLIEIGSESTVVDSVGSGTFVCYLSAAPGGGATIKAYKDSATVDATAAGIGTITYGAATTTDLSFDGIYREGYESDDIIHLSLYAYSPIANLFEVRLQLFAGTGAAATGDYYEKTIKLSDLQKFIQARATFASPLSPDTAAASLTDKLDSGALVDPDLTDLSGVKYVTRITPSEASGAQVGPIYDPGAYGIWIEIDIPKTDFVKVGRAGSGIYTWKSIHGYQITFKSTDSATAANINVGGIYAIGGKGPDVAIDGAQPYDYIYTYRNPQTGAESNPSVPMIEANYIAAGRRSVTVVCQGTASTGLDTEITGSGSIAIYRRGGLFADGFYRLIGYAANPGAGSIVAFNDNVPDNNVTSAKVASFDNYAPVYASLQIPLSATLTAGHSAGLNTVNLSSLPSGYTTVLTVGTEVTIGGGAKAETCIIEAVTDADTFNVFLQCDHVAGEQVSCEAIAFSPCKYTCTAYDSVFIAGNALNPHILYKSKAGNPDAFPVVDEVTGASHQLIVGNPANPIMNITEMNGEVVCMNLNNIYRVVSWNGVLQPPNETPAQRGLITPWAWAKGGGRLYYLSTDGIYAWSGGLAEKVSEAIDWIFKDRTVNGFAPLDRTKLNECICEYFQNKLHFFYTDTDGIYSRMIYDSIADRWHQERMDTSAPINLKVTAVYAERDTNTLLMGIAEGTGNDLYSGYIYSGEYRTDGWETTYSDGHYISYDVKTGFYTFGEPSLFKHFQDMVLEYECPATNTLYMDVFYDFSSVAAETILVSNLANGSGRFTVAIPFSPGDGSGSGYEAKTIAFRFYGQAQSGVKLCAMTFNFFTLTQAQRGRISEWQDLGHPYDKKLQTFTIDCDPKGQTIPLYLDTLSGLNGNTLTSAAVTFTISGNRGTKTFPISSGTLVKRVRIRSSVPADRYYVFDYSFGKIDYPPDIVYFTDSKDGGNPYEKYFTQMTMLVDTGGVAASVQIEVDGTVQQTLSVTATETDRDKVYTLNPAIKGRRVRLINTPGVNGKFQLWDWNPITSPADKGPVLHTDDWDALGHPYDKRLVNVTFEYEVTANTYMNMYFVRGATGSAQSNEGPIQFALTAGGRKCVTYTIPDTYNGTPMIVKMVRFQPSADNVNFKSWKYTFNKVDYPPDTIAASEWDSLDYPCEKICRNITLDVDTGGVTAGFVVQYSDQSGAVYNTSSYSINTTSTSRVRTFSFEPHIIGYKFRVVPTVPSGGKFQLFGPPVFERTLEPCPSTFWDSLEVYSGIVGFRLLKQLWVQYRCNSTITINVYRDDGQLFYTKQLPAHPQRDVERFYLPISAIVSGITRLNKSQRYRVTIDADDSSAPFYLYRDASRLEVINLSADQRAGYFQTILFSQLPLPK